MPTPAFPEERSSSAAQERSIARRYLALQRINHRLRVAGTPVSIATLGHWRTGRPLPTRSRSLARGPRP